MKKTLVCVAMSMILLSGCSYFNKTNDGIVKVNDRVITKAEFDKVLDKEIDSSFLKSFGGADNFVKSDDNVMYTIFKEKVINELIIKNLLEEEIEKRGIKVTEEDINKEKESIIDKVGSKEDLNKLIKSRGLTNNEFMDSLKTQVKIKKLVHSIKDIKVSDADAQNYYKKNTELFKHGEQVRASHILISSDMLQTILELKKKNPKITTEELNAKAEEYAAKQKARAEEILKEVKANPDNFEKIAQKKSDDRASGERGGEIGFFTKEAMVPEFSKAAFSMKPDTISETLVVTPYGYHIIKVTDRIEAGTTPFEKVKEEIKFYLQTQEEIKVLKNLTDGLLKTAKIDYLDESYKPKAPALKQVQDKK